MSAEVITAALSLVGTLAGTLGGIAKHNNLISRTYELEKEYSVLDERIRVANHRIEDLEEIEHEG